MSPLLFPIMVYLAELTKGISFVTVNAIEQPLTAPPRVSVTLGRKIYAQTTGFISVSPVPFPLF